MTLATLLDWRGCRVLCQNSNLRCHFLTVFVKQYFSPQGHSFFEDSEAVAHDPKSELRQSAWPKWILTVGEAGIEVLLSQSGREYYPY